MSELGKLRRKDNCRFDECSQVTFINPIHGGCSYNPASSHLKCTLRRNHDSTVDTQKNSCFNRKYSTIIFRLALFPYNHMLDVKSDYSSYRSSKMHARTHAHTHTHTPETSSVASEFTRRLHGKVIGPPS